MKKFLVAIAIVAVLSMSACGAEKAGNTSTENNSSATTTTSKAEVKSEYKKGELTATDFTSSYLNLKFTAPSGFTMSTEAEMEKLCDLGADTANLTKDQIDYSKAVTVYEMMATNMKTGSSVSILTEKLPLANMTAETYADLLAKNLTGLTSIKYTVSDKRETVTIASQQYLCMSVTAEANGKKINQNYYTRTQDGREITIIVSWMTENAADKDAIMNAIKTNK